MKSKTEKRSVGYLLLVATCLLSAHCAPASEGRRVASAVEPEPNRAKEAANTLAVDTQLPRDTTVKMSDSSTTSNAASSFEQCVMKAEIVAELVQVGYSLQLLASRNICVVPWESQNLWSFAGVLRINNTSKLPMLVRYADGSTAGFSLSAKVMDSRRQQQAQLPSHPIDGSRARTTEVSIVPGRYHDLVGNPAGYFLIPLKLAATGRDVSGAEVPVAQRFRQEFAIDFTASFAVIEQGKQRQVTQVLPTLLTVFVAQKQD
jgi:hypothetical protein